jgi:Flotillin-like protein FloA
MVFDQALSITCHGRLLPRLAIRSQSCRGFHGASLLARYRTNIDRLLGGAGAETIIARVGEGMVSTIGSATTHKSVLENPDHISKHVLSKRLDARRPTRSCVCRPISKLSTVETTLPEGPARRRIDSFDPVMFGSRSSHE